jgi:hypothetical protein
MPAQRERSARVEGSASEIDGDQVLRSDGHPEEDRPASAVRDNELDPSRDQRLADGSPAPAWSVSVPESLPGAAASGELRPPISKRGHAILQGSLTAAHPPLADV